MSNAPAPHKCALRPEASVEEPIRTIAPLDSLKLKPRHRFPKMNFVAGLQLRPAGRAMHFLAQPVAHDPGAAGRRAALLPLIPAVVEKAVFARSLVVDDVRMLARDRAVDVGVFGKRQIVAGCQTFGAVYTPGAYGVCE